MQSVYTEDFCRWLDLHCAQVSWVQPRVLTLEQAAGMKVRLDDWISKVSTTSLILQEDQIAAIA